MKITIEHDHEILAILGAHNILGMKFVGNKISYQELEDQRRDDYEAIKEYINTKKKIR